jgi:hypothetical protein
VIGSPFLLELLPSEPALELTTISGSGLERVVAGEPCTICVKLVDQFGNPIPLNESLRFGLALLPAGDCMRDCIRDCIRDCMRSSDSAWHGCHVRMRGGRGASRTSMRASACMCSLRRPLPTGENARRKKRKSDQYKGKWDRKQQHYEMTYLPTKTGELQLHLW